MSRFLPATASACLLLAQLPAELCAAASASALAPRGADTCQSPPDLSPAWEVTACVVPDSQLAYQINAIGTALPDGSRLLVSRAEVSGVADHNVIRVLDDGEDVVTTTPAQYPSAGTIVEGRFGVQMTPDPESPDSAVFLADAGTICSGSGQACSGTYPEFQNGRIFRVDLETGAMVTVIDRGQLVDPFAVAQDAEGNVYVADRGKFDVSGDGRVARLDGAALVTVLDGVDAQDVAFLPDGSYLVSTSGEAAMPGVYHVVNNTIDSKVTERFGSLALPVEAPECGVRFYLNTGSAIYEIVDDTNDFQADHENLIADDTSLRIGLETDAGGSLHFVVAGSGGNDELLTITETAPEPDPKVCGDPVNPSTSASSGARAISASDALHALRAAVGTVCCFVCVCDVNDSASITASDALLILTKGVGRPVALECPVCD
jgi:hypothetical protein